MGTGTHFCGVCVIAYLKHEQASSCGKDGGLLGIMSVLELRMVLL